MGGWIRWAVSQLFFALSVLCSVSFAVASPDLLRSLDLREAQLGQLGGAYLAAFSIALPILGGLMSTIALRWLLGGSALVAALGTLRLASATDFHGALGAMALMGIGLSTAFVGVITVAGREFPRTFAPMAALSNAITNLGSALLAMVSTLVPILADFRRPFRLLSVLLLATAALLAIVLRERGPTGDGAPRESPGPGRATLRASELPAAVARVLRTPQVWFVGLCFGGLFGSFLAYADLWNIPYQMKVFGHTIQQAAGLNAAFPLGMMAGSLVGGTWAGRAGFLPPVRVFAVLTLLVEGLLFAEVLPDIGAGVAFFLVGFGSSAASLALAALPAHLEAALVPIATTIVMTLTYLLSAMVQVLAGGPGGTGGITTFATYRDSLGILLVPVAIAAVAAFLLRGHSASGERPPASRGDRR